MYKILIKYDNDKLNLWSVYGSSTTSTIGATSFTDFETDDINVLRSELIKLDKEFGFDRIKVVKEIDVNYSVDVTDNEESDNESDNTKYSPTEG